ncbi:PilZ domain-containing protein [Geothrix sp. PMB-07]|uniref:PilZ domain-containing protein n=1 Tax=Geothrix sp. PMB-07 TaxID=3068640 RepID=UPI002742203C|nr:PilZ domain-containing protein [Geothrix sp. PMB-07]WLT33541.1 PilZ domain-containing protein [Geothrix sp. PMB-07]
MTPSLEHRQHRRVPIAYQVKLVADDRIIAYPQAINLSLGGILVKGRDHLPVGCQCGVAILVGQGEPGRRVVARGTVVRNDEQGMAIAFSKALDANSEAALRQLLEALGVDGDPFLLPDTGSE